MKNRSQEGLDVEVVCGENDFEQHLLVDSDKLLVPFTDVSRALACLILGLVRVCIGKRLSTMMFAVFQDLARVHGQLMPCGIRTQDRLIRRNTHLLENARRYIGQRDRLIALANVYHHREQLETCLRGIKGERYLRACFL